MQTTCALSRGDTEKATEYLEKYRSQREAEGWSEARIIFNFGYMYENANLIKEAEKFMRHALALDPDSPQILEGLAWVLIDHDINLEEGMKLAERAVKSDPESYNIIDTWGWGLYKSGRYEEALEALNKAWELRGLYDPDIMRHIQLSEKALAESIN